MVYIYLYINSLWQEDAGRPAVHVRGPDRGAQQPRAQGRLGLQQRRIRGTGKPMV